ncbi:MAG: hypothetical protein ACRENM_05550 [Candidatus Dormibacteraceae bacterium]
MTEGAPGLSCSVCAAPTLTVDGRCPFCHSESSGRGDQNQLVGYLAARLPFALAKRSGLLGRGPVREVTIRVGQDEFRARLERRELRLRPAMTAELWSDRLVGELSRQATGDAALRAALARAGWDMR